MKFYDRGSRSDFTAVIQHLGGALVAAKTEPNDAAVIGSQGPDMLSHPQKFVRRGPEYQDETGWHDLRH